MALPGMPWPGDAHGEDLTAEPWPAKSPEARASDPRNGWSYEYSDGFGDDRAEPDAMFCSRFWPEGAFPPSEPCLQFNGLGHDRNLQFVGWLARPAYLGYRFPAAGTAPGPIKGTVCLDVLYPPGVDRGLYAVWSSDGTTWSEPVALPQGRAALDVRSSLGACTIAFFGTYAAIDNLTACLAVPAATITVPGAARTIQQAIDAARDGDLIEVGPGIYQGPGNVNLQMRGKSITVRSTAGATKTTILCGDGSQARGFYIHEGEGPGCVIQGFTIQAGAEKTAARPDLSGLGPGGGGILCEKSSPMIVGCRIRGCLAQMGGGIACAGGSPTLVDCTIVNCAATSGQGMGGGIAVVRQANVRLIRCVIEGNRAAAAALGGGLYVANSTVEVRDCRIVGNGSSDLGAGGGVCGEGPGLEITLRQTLIAGNLAQAGSGVWTTGDPGLLSLRNCTVADNKLTGPAALAAGGISAEGCRVTITNSILWGNQGQPLQFGTSSAGCQVTYCNVQGGCAGQGNLNLDPLFVAPESRDYHLRSQAGRLDPATGLVVADKVHSPCIDAGDPQDPLLYEVPGCGGQIDQGAYGGTPQSSGGRTRFIYHVQAKAGSDDHGGLGHADAFATIQRAVTAARDGDVVLVWPGVYEEEVDLLGKAILIQGVGDTAIVSAPAGCAFSFYKGEGSDSIVRNLVIRTSKYAVFCNGASPTLANLTVAGNRFGVVAYDGAAPTIHSCIFWDNSLGDLFQCTARYSRVQTAATAAGLGNILGDPLFADTRRDDFHLLSARGRYVPRLDLWIADKVQSPCIDAGRPDAGFWAEPWPNGRCIDMGVFGGTPHASLSRSDSQGDQEPGSSAGWTDAALPGRDWAARAASLEGMDILQWMTRP